MYAIQNIQNNVFLRSIIVLFEIKVNLFAHTDMLIEFVMNLLYLDIDFLGYIILIFKLQF